MNRPIYLDYNATTPCDPRVLESMLPYFGVHYGNPASRDHFMGWEAEDSVQNWKEELAKLFKGKPDGVIYTSGATESVNLALKGLVENAGKGKNHIITCQTEHQAVLDTCAFLESKGVKVTYLKVDRLGNISLDDLEALIDEATICVALMYANNETGIIHPIKEISEITRRKGTLLFCDATQALGKIPVNVREEGIDMMAFSAHKMYGPKGVGGLYVNQKSIGSNISPLIHGGKHQKGLRSGTLNVPGIVGLGYAAMLSKKVMEDEMARLTALRDRIEDVLVGEIEGVSVNGTGNRLAHVSNLVIAGINAEKLLLSLSKDLALSKGSACASLIHKPSHVLRAMGLSDMDALGSIRISLGRFTTAEDIDMALEKLVAGIKAQQQSKAATV
ncbi:cysteine desulfurase family protein [Belliella marina]|uniref:cysteine desulfurase n=1 Tax=Belliella marina TaxID=1644146 RepID=A0ABW4VV67_9BACT